jgi:hypothetical protein
MPINWRRRRTKEFGKSELFKWEDGLLSVVKIRQNSTCALCGKEIKKGCYCLGVHYMKVCINCSDKFIDNFTESLKEQEKTAEALKKNIRENLGEYVKNNVINSV